MGKDGARLFVREKAPIWHYELAAHPVDQWFCRHRTGISCRPRSGRRFWVGTGVGSALAKDWSHAPRESMTTLIVPNAGAMTVV